MKINEITIDRNKRLADQLSNAELSNEIMALYELVKETSHDFSLMAYEAYNPDIAPDLVDSLALLLKRVNMEYSHITQASEIIQFLLDYFENN